MNKKTIYIVGAIVLVIILIWGYKTKGWFGGTVSSTGGAGSSTTGNTGTGRIRQTSTILCSKTLANLQMNVNGLQSSLNGNPPTAVQFQTAWNSLSEILYLLQNCVSLNRSNDCAKALDSLRMNVNDMPSQVFTHPPTAYQIMSLSNALLIISFILSNCVTLNGSVLCGKTLATLKTNVNDLQSSLNNNPPTGVQFQTASNALLNILYIFQNCIGI